MRAGFAAVLLSVGVPAAVQAATPSDLRDYAIASCLIAQTASPALHTEGYRLADIVIRRAGIDPFVWKPLTRAVEQSLARHGMVLVHVDGPVAQATQAAPVASCLRAIDDPAVRATMARLGRTTKR